MSSLGSELVGRTTKDDDVGKEIERGVGKCLC